MRKYGRNIKKGGRMPAVLLAGCILLAGCGAGGEEEEAIVVVDRQEEEAVYDMDQVIREDLVKTATIMCSYRQTNEEEVTISGFGKTLEEICVQTGDSVKKGQLLARLSGGDREEEIRELEYRIARNKLLLGYAETDEAYDISYRYWIYVYNSSGSEAEKEALDTDLENIRQSYRYRREDYQDAIDVDSIRLEYLRREMEESCVYAPMDGEVSTVIYELKGKIISEEKLLMKIVDSSQCLFKTDQVQYADCFREGEPVELVVNLEGSDKVINAFPYDMEHWEGTLFFEVPEGEAGGIQVGASGILYVTEETREQVLTVSKSALFAADKGYYVYVLDENNVRQVRWVETGLWGDSRTEIVSGLAEGDYVVVR